MSWKVFSTRGLVIPLEKSVFLPSTLCSPSTHFADVLKWHKCLVPHLYVLKISHPKHVLLNLTFLPSLVHPNLDVQQWPVSCLSLIIIAKQMKNQVSNHAFSEAADIMSEHRQYGDKGNVHMSCMNLLSLWRMTTRSRGAEKVTPAEPCERCWHGSSSHLSQNTNQAWFCQLLVRQERSSWPWLLYFHNQ